MNRSIETETVHCTIKDHVAVVTMDRPPVNAVDRQLQQDMMRVMDELSEMPDARVAILTGAGKMFCAGADIKARRAAAETEGVGFHWAVQRRNRGMFDAISECAIPVIAAINGPALGAGLVVAAACDILIAADSAFVALPEIGVGLIGGGRHAQRLFSHSRVRRMVLGGMRVPAPELYRLGVIEESVPADRLMERAQAIASEISEKSPVAVRLGKLALNTGEFMTLRDGLRFETTQSRVLGDSEDAREAQRAFVEKRKPVFKGR